MSASLGDSQKATSQCLPLIIFAAAFAHCHIYKTSRNCFGSQGTGVAGTPLFRGFAVQLLTPECRVTSSEPACHLAPNNALPLHLAVSGARAPMRGAGESSSVSDFLSRDGARLHRSPVCTVTVGQPGPWGSGCALRSPCFQQNRRQHSKAEIQRRKSKTSLKVLRAETTHRTAACRCPGRLALSERAALL